MSLNNHSYLQNITSERTRLRDATIPISVASKPKDEKLCTYCRRAIMKPYLRPPNRFIDENGIDNGGFRPNTWYWLCGSCGNKEEMSTQSEGQKKGYKIKNPVTTKMQMHLGTYDRISQSWDKRKRRKGGLDRTELDDDLKDDIYRAYGATDGVTLADEREYHYDGKGFT